MTDQHGSKEGEAIGSKLKWQVGGDPQDYPYEYFVTRGDDWHNEEMFGQWLDHTAGKSLRIKRVYIHSDTRVPEWISRKVLRDVFKSGVEFNHRYFHGVKKSIDVGLNRFNEVDAFESAAVRLKRREKGLTLDVYLKAKKPFHHNIKIEPLGHSVGITGSLTLRNLTGHLDSVTAGGTFGLFELAFRRAEIEQNFPLVVGSYSAKTFLRYEMKPVSYGQLKIGQAQLAGGIELYSRPQQNKRQSVVLEYLMRDLRAEAQGHERLGPHDNANEFVRERLRDGNLEYFIGGRLSYNVWRKKNITRLLRSPISSESNARISLLLGNDAGVELSASRISKTTTTGYLTSSILHWTHLAQLDIFKSFHGPRGLVANDIFDEQPRMKYNFMDNAVRDQIQCQALRLNNSIRADISGFADSSVADAIRPFIFAHSSIGVVNPRNAAAMATTKADWQIGAGFSWAASSGIFCNVRLGLIDQRGLRPTLAADFHSI